MRNDRVLERAGWTTAVIDGTSTVGGGSAPGSELPTRLVQLDRNGAAAQDIELELRALAPPIVARIEDDHVVLDLRTVMPDEDETIVRLLGAKVS